MNDLRHSAAPARRPATNTTATRQAPRWRMRLRSAALLIACVASMGARGDSYSFELEGVKGNLRRQLKRHLEAAQGEQSTELTPARIRALHRRAPATLEAGLEALGYYGATIVPGLAQEGASWRATYRIGRGEPVRVTAVDIDIIGDAREDPAFADSAARFPLRPGDVLKHAAYEDGKRELEHLLADRGYFDAQFTASEVRVDPGLHGARIALAVDSGPRYRFGPVQWPDAALARDFLARFVSFETGAPYRADDLLDLQGKLTNSNYFASVAVAPRPDLARQDEVPVEITLEPRKPHRYSFGLGYGTDTGPRGRAAWQRPFVNARGHRFDSDLRVSPVSSSLAASYGIPLQRPDVDTLSFTTGVLNENTDVSDTTRAQLGAARLTTRFGWQETLALDYELERFDVGNDLETTGLLIPSARWSRTWADDRVRARRGLRLGLDVRGAQSSVLSRISFLRLRIDGKFIQAIGKGRVIARGEFGATATSDFDKLPVTQRFFAGGDNSLRGFDYRELGPRDEDGKVVGGRYLALGSLELEHAIRGAWSGAVFSDFGNAVDSLADPFEYSVGAGLRWQSPVGPVRIDLANGISDEDKPWRLHIVVGPDL